MSKILNLLHLKLSPYYSKILMAVMLILFVSVAVYFWNRNSLSKKKTNDFSDVANANNRHDEITVYYVSVDWCPYCKKAQGPWNDFTGQYNKKIVNGHMVNCVNIKEGDSSFASFCKEHDITKFPTVFILYGDNKYDFDSSVSLHSLQQFVEFVANK